jgi:hypothetical protein|tara:strand:+ start:559 stop:825 length:267 start_codon:yes stop_codon:yes gene_type:complete
VSPPLLDFKRFRGCYRSTKARLRRGHPLVRQLFDIMHKHQISANDLAKKAGLGVRTIESWTLNRQPTVANLQAALNVLGYELYIKPRK